MGQFGIIHGMGSLLNPACFAAGNTTNSSLQGIAAINVWPSSYGIWGNVTPALAPLVEQQVVREAIESSRTPKRSPLYMQLFAPSYICQQVDTQHASSSTLSAQASTSSDEGEAKSLEDVRWERLCHSMNTQDIHVLEQLRRLLGEDLFEDITNDTGERTEIIDRTIQRCKELAAGFLTQQYAEEEWQRVRRFEDAMSIVSILCDILETELAYGIAEKLTLKFDLWSINRAIDKFVEAHRLKRNLQGTPLPKFGRRDISRYFHPAFQELIEHLESASKFWPWRIEEQTYNSLDPGQSFSQYRLHESHMSAFCYPLAKLLPVHNVGNDEKSSQTVTDFISFIELSLSADGWKTGEAPTEKQLLNALYGFRGSIHFPFITPPINGHAILLNGHHRVAALVALVAHKILPPETLTRIPFLILDFDSADLAKEKLCEIFREAQAEEQVLDFSWLDALSADPHSVEFLKSHGYTQSYRAVLG